MLYFCPPASTHSCSCSHLDLRLVLSVIRLERWFNTSLNCDPISFFRFVVRFPDQIQKLISWSICGCVHLKPLVCFLSLIPLARVTGCQVTSWLTLQQTQTNNSWLVIRQNFTQSHKFWFEEKNLKHHFHLINTHDQTMIRRFCLLIIVFYFFMKLRHNFTKRSSTFSHIQVQYDAS